MLIGVEFTFLPDPVDIGFIGTGSALGAVVVGLTEWTREWTAGYVSLAQISERAAVGGLLVGMVACIVWVAGLSGVEFRP